MFSTRGLGPGQEIRGIAFRIDERLAEQCADPLRAPEGDCIRAIELFVCESCNWYAPATLELRVRTPDVMQFLGAAAVPALTAPVLDDKARRARPRRPRGLRRASRCDR